jgi:hypothetical protein
MGWTSFLVIPVALYVIVSLRVLKQYERGVVFLLGKFAGVRGPGLTLIFVPIQQMVRVSLRTVTMQVPSQKIITRDNISVDIAAVMQRGMAKEAEAERERRAKIVAAEVVIGGNPASHPPNIKKNINGGA